MRLPTITLPPLSTQLQAIRDEINALCDADRRALMQRLAGDTLRRNDERHQLAYERHERERTATRRRAGAGAAKASNSCTESTLPKRAARIDATGLRFRQLQLAEADCCQVAV